MSMEYWPIMGYGVEIRLDMLDPTKIESVLGIVNDGEDDIDLADVLDKICSMPGPWRLVWGCTAEMYDDPIWYLYCPSLLPWSSETWRNLSRESVEQAIRALLAPILRENFDPKKLEFKEIADVGCG